MSSIADQWQTSFWQAVQRRESADRLKQATVPLRLGEWTSALTTVVVATCEAMGWRASAKGHPLDLLPIAHSEYLGLDVIAFATGQTRWRFPVAVIELENSRDDNRIAYSLWKVLCVRADLRIVFCYRRSAEQASALIRFLCDEVMKAMSLETRMSLEGETLVVIGSRDESATFPYSFFKWWQFENNTGIFRLV
jgi:hypothetical protein